MDLRDGRPARIRPSAAERERVIRRLRAGREEERLSLETFVERVDVVYTARSRHELAAVVADLPESGRVGRAVLAGADALGRWTALFAATWHHARLPRLVLAERAVLGRSRASDCVISDPTVSRMHALVRFERGHWWLSDLGSTNGTWINGRAVLDEAEVTPGDHVALGNAAFRAVCRPRTMGRRWSPRSARRPASSRRSSSIGVS